MNAHHFRLFAATGYFCSCLWLAIALFQPFRSKIFAGVMLPRHIIGSSFINSEAAGLILFAFLLVFLILFTVLLAVSSSQSNAPQHEIIHIFIPVALTFFGVAFNTPFIRSALGAFTISLLMQLFFHMEIPEKRNKDNLNPVSSDFCKAYASASGFTAVFMAARCYLPTHRIITNITGSLLLGFAFLLLCCALVGNLSGKKRNRAACSLFLSPLTVLFYFNARNIINENDISIKHYDTVALCFVLLFSCASLYFCSKNRLSEKKNIFTVELGSRFRKD